MHGKIKFIYSRRKNVEGNNFNVYLDFNLNLFLTENL